MLWIEKLFVDLIIDVSLFDVFLLSEYREIAGVLLWFGLFREERLVKTTLCAGGVERRFMTLCRLPTKDKTAETTAQNLYCSVSLYL